MRFYGKTNFEQRPKNAYLCLLAELAHGQCKFFCHQTKRKVMLDKVREGLRPITLRFRAKARKLILGSVGTHIDHLSVNISKRNVMYNKNGIIQGINVILIAIPVS